jgi:hypothetical protein
MAVSLARCVSGAGTPSNLDDDVELCTELLEGDSTGVSDHLL